MAPRLLIPGELRSGGDSEAGPGSRGGGSWSGEVCVLNVPVGTGERQRTGRALETSGARLTEH